MAFFDSRVATFAFADGTSERALAPYITELSGLPGPRNLNEVTALGDTGARWIPGLENVTITLSGIYDDTATTGPDAVLGGGRTATAGRTFSYGTKGSAATSVKYSGTAFVSNYEVVARVGNRVEWSATLAVDGTVARGTF